MASQSLYRKWRSQTFSDLVGQEAVTRTLLNAVREGRLAHAYLFCGPRGTGKTSSARLLAKAINCANPHNGEPCNECISCREITAGHSPDVIEIDAASNTGVDSIRDLREHAGLMGSGGHYKVYVVDECHMLTSQAFNALLKTLEEPPPHVIFVLATTEAHKVLPTVVSRCQRFDFHRISTREIVAHLRRVAEGEGLSIEPAAADLLARTAQGGMRDALSLLDQAVAFCGETVDLERTRAMLGLADPAAVRALLTYVAEQQSAEGLHQIHDLVETGADLRQVQLQLAEEWRALMLARAGANVAEVMDRGDEEAREIAALANRFSLEELMACARVFARIETPARGLPVPQLALELMFLECVSIRRHGGVPMIASAAMAQPAPPSPRPAVPTPTASPPPSAALPLARPAVAAPPPPIHPSPPAIEELDLDAIERGEAPRSTPAMPTPAMPTPAMPTPTIDPAPDELVWDELPAEPLPAEPLAPPTRGASPVTGGLPNTSDNDDWLDRVQRHWEMIRKVSRQKGPKVYSLLKEASPIEIQPGDPFVVVLAVNHEFHFGKLREPANRELVEWAIVQVLEAPLKVRFVMAGSQGQGQPIKPRPGGDGMSTPSGGTGARTGATPSHHDGGYANGAAPARMNGQQASYTNGAASAASRTPLPPPAAQVRDAQPAYQTPPAAPAMPSPAASGPDASALEAEVRADPIIQEILRACGAELTDVRPLSSDEAE